MATSATTAATAGASTANPRPSATVYLGKIEDLVAAAEAAGDVAALWHTAERLEMVPLLDSVLPTKRHQGLSCGNQPAQEVGVHLCSATSYDTTFLPELSRQTMEEVKRRKLDAKIVELPCGHYTLGETPFKFIDGYQICSFLLRNL